MTEGVVHEAAGGTYRVRLPDGTDARATLRGRLKREQRTGGRVVIGDRVSVVAVGDGWTIETVSERATELLRRGPGGRRPKVVAANLDHVLPVVAAMDPEATPALIDRLLVVSEASGIQPRLVINKTDLPGAGSLADALAGLYRGVGYTVLRTSVRTDEGLEELREVLCRGTSALVGPSGVGKSSLLNALDAGLRLRVGELSHRLRRGRHTTATARLIPLACGGFVADTPGFSDVGLWGVPPGELSTCFPEFRERATACRFRGCAHVSEPDCAIVEAVDSELIPKTRYASYLALLGDTEGR